MRAAAALLATARTLDGLEDALRGAGVINEAVELASGERQSLAVDSVADARLAGAMGGVRLLLASAPAAVGLRDIVQRLASRLATRAPHVLWIVAVIDDTGENAAIAAISSGVASPRVSSFSWEPEHVVDSDAETLCALAAVRADSDVLYHARCAEVLGRDALTRRFYRQLEAQVVALAHGLPNTSPADGRAVALLYASRLLFLCFVQAKGWLDGDRAFLASRFDDCMRTGGQFHRRVLLPLFFGTLNTPVSRRATVARAFGRIPFLNGGLFTRTPLERRLGARLFSDERLGELLERVFQRFRFVAREDSATWSEAAVDPEMLGRVFESLMAPTERKAGGVFFTPHHLVARVADEALSALREELRPPRLDALRQVRVLDPACGSGSFLVYVLERLADEQRRAGDARPVSAVRRDALASSIFGVDRDPTAVWLCELRLWLSVVIESDEPEPQRIPPLPNLDRNIRVGDALLGPAFASDPFAIAGHRTVAALRHRYVRATGTRKRALASALDREERRRVLAHLDRVIVAAQHARREHLVAVRSRDLFGERQFAPGDLKRGLRRLRGALRWMRTERRRVQDGGALPFSFGASFAEAQASGGFDVVVGNPPWVRLHRIPASLRARFRETYEVFRAAPWMHGAGARAAAGFSSQVDLAALFVERGLSLLRPGGVLSLLLPVKLWRSLAGGGVRQLLLRRARLLRVEDLSESRHTFGAAVYPSLLLARSGCTGRDVTIAVHSRDAYREWQTSRDQLLLDESPGAPWLLLSPAARSGFRRVGGAGTPLGSTLGAPKLGVKSGFNSAFVVRVEDTSRDIAWVVDADGERGKVELSLLRPALRGDAVTPWVREESDQWIVWPHDERGPIARLPAHAGAWLRRKYAELTSRSDAVRGRRWWRLFRVEAADASAPRVVWADFGRRPRALVLPVNDPAVPLNTCYVLHCANDADAWAVAALLNSPLAAAWLNALAEPARGGYRRYMSWTVGQLPVPRDWVRARAVLSAAGRAARADPESADERLLDAALDAFGLARAHVAALLGGA